MPYQYYIDPAVNCVFIRHFDIFEIDEGVDAFAKVLKDSAYRKGMNLLRDINQTSFPNSMGDKSFFKKIRQRSKEFNIRFKNCRIAWVLSSSTDFAIVHRWTVTTRSSGEVERKPFRDIEKAMEWLGIPEGYEIKYPEPGEAT